MEAMNNLYLTLACDGGCPYCFLKGKLQDTGHDGGRDGISGLNELSLSDAVTTAEFFREDGRISFLGGEPTLHSRFRSITDIFLSRGFRIFLFSNCRFDIQTAEYLHERENIFFVFNIAEPSTYSSTVWRRIEANLQLLRNRINSLAISIHGLKQDTGYIVELATRFGVKAVKIGVAAPSGTGRNEFIPLSRRHLVAEPLVRLVEALGRESVMSYGECEKLKPCMLDRDQAMRMKASGWKGSVYINRQCRTGGNIEIGRAHV